MTNQLQTINVPIKGFEGLYWVNDQGLILSRKGIKKSQLGNSGYQVVDLYKNNTRKKELVHRLVAKAFLPNPNNFSNVCHKDDNPQNNIATNLFWGTQKMNVQDMMNKNRGGYKVHNGEENGFARLVERQIREIKELLSLNKTCAEISRIYKVSRSTISMVKRGLIWSHIT